MISRLIPFLPQVAGSLAVALALSITWGVRVDSLRHGYKVERDSLRADVVEWRDKHHMQEQSIRELIATLDAKNAESDARAAQYAAQREADAKSVAEADLRAAESIKRQMKLEAIARDGTSVCGVSDKLREALEGL